MRRSSRSPSIRLLPTDATPHIDPLPALAARSLRLLAVMIDSLIAGVLVFFTAFGAIVGGAGTIGAFAGAKDQLLAKVGGGGLAVAGLILAVVAGTALFVLTLYQWYLLSTLGQTIGKRACGIRIVDATTGKPAGFIRAVLLRSLLPMLMVSVLTALLGWLFPPIGGLLAGINLVPIFGPGRRCLHDYLAGTDVRWVEAKSEKRMQIAMVGVGLLTVGSAVAAVMLTPNALDPIRQWPTRLRAQKPTPTVTGVAPAPIAPAPAPVPVLPAPAPAPAPPAPAPVAIAPALTPGIYSWVDGEGTTSFTNDPSSIPEKFKASTRKLGE